MWRIWTQRKEHCNKKTFLIFESLKIKLKNPEKRIHVIVQHSRPSKDNESSETKIYPSKQKKRKSRNQTYKIFCKKCAETLTSAFMKKIFKNLKPKND